MSEHNARILLSATMLAKAFEHTPAAIEHLHLDRRASRADVLDIPRVREIADDMSHPLTFYDHPAEHWVHDARWATRTHLVRVWRGCDQKVRVAVPAGTGTLI